MLALSRRISEKVLIGECIELMVVEVSDNAVKLGFSAPSDVVIHREEVHRRIQLEKLRAERLSR